MEGIVLHPDGRFIFRSRWKVLLSFRPSHVKEVIIMIQSLKCQSDVLNGEKIFRLTWGPKMAMVINLEQFTDSASFFLSLFISYYAHLNSPDTAIVFLSNYQWSQWYASLENKIYLQIFGVMSTSQVNWLNDLVFNRITRKSIDNLSFGRNTLQTPAAEEWFVIFISVYNRIRPSGRIDEQMFIKNW